MNTDPNYPVTFFDFKTWLDSKSLNEVVGEALICGHCPLARLLTDKGYQGVEIYPVRSYIDSTKYTKNPSWVYDFVKQVDKDKQVGEQITAKDVPS